MAKKSKLSPLPWTATNKDGMAFYDDDGEYVDIYQRENFEYLCNKLNRSLELELQNKAMIEERDGYVRNAQMNYEMSTKLYNELRETITELHTEIKNLKGE